MDVKELRAKNAALLKEAEELRAKFADTEDSMSAEDEKKFDALLDEVEANKAAEAKAERDSRFKAIETWASQPREELPVAEVKSEDADVEPDGISDLGSMPDSLRKGLAATQRKEYSKALEAYMRSGIRGVAAVSPAHAKALQEGVDTSGGFLVPEDFRAELIKKVATLATVRPNARAITTSRDQVTFPKVNYTTDNKYTSPVRITYTGEIPSSSTVHRATDTVFGQERINVHTAMLSLALTNDVIEDAAFDVVGYVRELFAEAAALDENDAFWNGTGVGRPEGILLTTGANFPSASSSGASASVTADGFIDTFYALPAQYRMNAKWYMSSSTAKEVRKLKDSSNRYLWDSMSAGGLLTRGDQDQLLGKPVVIDEFMPSIAANAYPVVFGDLSAYYVVDRVGLSLQVLTEAYAEVNQIVVVGRKRFGGQTVEPWKLQAMKISA